MAGASIGNLYLEIEGKNGSRRRISESERLFFAGTFPTSAVHLLPIICGLTLKLRISAILFIFEAGVRKILQHFRLGSGLDDEHICRLGEEIIGFRPRRVFCPGLRLEMQVDEKAAFANTLFFLNQTAFTNDYCLSNKNVWGKVFIDAGANVGAFSLVAARMGARRIYAFEPLFPTYKVLCRNIIANGLSGKVVPINCALGEAAGSGKLSYSTSCDGGASLVALGSRRHAMQVKIRTVDGFMAKRGRLDFLKIDVEGFEAEVLRGARKTLARFKPVLCFSAYHLPGDKERLPAAVMLIRPDYRCALHKGVDENCYCD
ncbi:MAG: FkbM family methyltransferase [Candidatus Micrarchaeia archaeon]